jgi:argininosuccinate lyase
MKGLPLAYDRDMQEDTEPLFDAAATVISSISVSAGMLEQIAFDAGRMKDALAGGFLTATDAADYLVKKGMSFRRAHETVGRIVARLEKEGRTLADLSADEWRGFSELFDNDIVDAVTPEKSLAARSVTGGTAPEQVSRMIERVAALEEREP